MSSENIKIITIIIVTIFALWLLRLMTSLILMRELIYELLGFRKNTWLEMFERWIWIAAIILFVDSQIIKFHNLVQKIFLVAPSVFHYVTTKLSLIYIITQTIINHEIEKLFNGFLKLFR